MPEPLRILVVGPRHASSNSRGGMAELIGLMRDAHDSRVRVRTIATYVDDVPARRLWVGVSGTARAVTLVLLGRVDVLHVHLAHRGSVARKAFPLLAAKLTRTPAVIHAHSYDFAGWFDRLGTVPAELVRRALPAAYWYVLGDALVEQYRSRLRLGPDDIRVLPNPVRIPARPTPRPSDPQDSGAQKSAPSTLAVSFGRLGGRKGSYDLVAALTLLAPAARERLQVIIAGDGEVEQVRDAAAAAGVDDVLSVRSWVEAPERDALLARADVFVLPSYDEGLPLALLEAMAWGLASITTPVGAIPDVVTDGTDAVLIAPGDRAALAAALERLVLDPAARTAIGAAARDRSLAYEADAWFAGVVSDWTALAGRRRGRSG